MSQTEGTGQPGKAVAASSGEPKAPGTAMSTNADLLGGGADWAWETDADLKFSWLSPEYESVSGIDPARILGRFRFDFLSQVA